MRDCAAPLAMGCRTRSGSLVPILGFVLPFAMRLGSRRARVRVVGLFAVGYYAGTLSERNPFVKGAEVVAFGCAVFAVSYLAGHFIPPLFGHAPIGVGVKRLSLRCNRRPAAGIGRGKPLLG